MSDILSYDGSETSEVVESREADEKESLLIGEALANGETPKLAGKYSSPEELEKAYLELQQKMGQQQQTQPEQPAPEPPRERSVGDKLNDAYNAYTSDKGLSEEQLKAFEDVSKEDLIKSFFENNQQQDGNDLSDSQLQQVYARAGNEEGYKQMIQWAGQNLSTSEIEAFDEAIDSGDMNRIGFAVDAVARRFYDANGKEGNMLQGRGVPPAEGFRSQAELIRAMNDPRYEEDEAYRNDVLIKLENSPNVKFGN